MQANYVQRLRLKFGKIGNVRFIGHLDVARTLQRAVNRAGIPIAYTQGFNKRPRMQLADALPLGFSSECEIADLWLASRIDPDDARKMLTPVMPQGIELYEVNEVELSEPALQNQTVQATYSVIPLEELEADDLQLRIDDLLDSSAIKMERKGKIYDLKPRIFSLDVIHLEHEPIRLEMQLSMDQGNVGRPDEVLKALGLDPAAASIHRTRLTLAGNRTDTG